ncbi:hypothetical protein SAMN02745938_1276 [Flavobacterium psychrophilum DSM 3660]|nr:hypothetical protein [Flavobacterium psychrophilum]SCY39730.1 hypothetical protein SAMN02745938_1276 [Flavobacterium psychrophilum DSM 3660] [Flavobacterium psychrophilum DSM 3660 = ATCC 49418]
MAKEVKYKTVTLYRSAITGRTVTEEYAKKNPKTTVKEVTKVPI